MKTSYGFQSGTDPTNDEQENEQQPATTSSTHRKKVQAPSWHAPSIIALCCAAAHIFVVVDNTTRSQSQADRPLQSLQSRPTTVSVHCASLCIHSHQFIYQLPSSSTTVTEAAAAATSIVRLQFRCSCAACRIYHRLIAYSSHPSVVVLRTWCIGVVCVVGYI